MSYKLIQADEALTLSGVIKKDGRHIKVTDLGFIKKPWMLTDSKKILFIGNEKEFNQFYKKEMSKLKKPKIKDSSISGLIMPGFVESHTHTVFAGDRKHEFELRNKGQSYQDIAKSGGGIQFTMDQTAKASEKELYNLAHQRVEEFLRQGVSVLEIKSGYGADLKTELKILNVIEKLNIEYNRKPKSISKKNFSSSNLKIIPTFLGLHSVPKGQTKAEYLNLVLKKYLPEITKKTKVRHADIFCDEGYFDKNDLDLYVQTLRKLGWTFSAHTDQLSSLGLGLRAAELGALSISHCVNMKDDEIKKVAQTNTVFNLLPTSDFYLKINYPKARTMIDSGGNVSLATDFNPGSSPTQNINFVGVLARLEMKMSLPEVIGAYTYNAAKSLGLEKSQGSLQSGCEAQFQILDKSWTDLFYQI